MADTQELTRLHYLTDEEADLIQDYRLLCAETKRMCQIHLRLLSEHHVEPTAGNVVSITRPAD